MNRPPSIGRRALLAALAALAAPQAVLAAKPYRVPRTSFGEPDLQGTWSTRLWGDMERPKEFKTWLAPTREVKAFMEKRRAMPPVDDPDYKIAGETTEWWERGDPAELSKGLALTSWIADPADGKLPYRDGVEALIKARLDLETENVDDPENRDDSERCLTSLGGPPIENVSFNANIQIVQSKGHVVMLFELMHDVRIIPIGARHLPNEIRPWGGDSVGRWEGDTLVVETTNFDGVHLLRDGFRLWFSDKASIVERFTRTSAGEIRYEFEVADPTVFTQTWRGLMPLKATNARMFEYACHEGNYGLEGILSGGRAMPAKPAN